MKTVKIIGLTILYLISVVLLLYGGVPFWTVLVVFGIIPIVVIPIFAVVVMPRRKKNEM